MSWGLKDSISPQEIRISKDWVQSCKPASPANLASLFIWSWSFEEQQRSRSSRFEAFAGAPRASKRELQLGPSDFFLFYFPRNFRFTIFPPAIPAGNFPLWRRHLKWNTRPQLNGGCCRFVPYRIQCILYRNMYIYMVPSIYIPYNRIIPHAADLYYTVN